MPPNFSEIQLISINPKRTAVLLTTNADNAVHKYHNSRNRMDFSPPDFGLGLIMYDYVMVTVIISYAYKRLGYRQKLKLEVELKGLRFKLPKLLGVAILPILGSAPVLF